MKIKELNKKIFYNASQVNREDYLEMLSFCYDRNREAGSAREQKMELCMRKWQSLYAYLDSPELMESYTQFYRRVKE